VRQVEIHTLAERGATEGERDAADGTKAKMYQWIVPIGTAAIA
jgi:hypothetical protein